MQQSVVAVLGLYSLASGEKRSIKALSRLHTDIQGSVSMLTLCRLYDPRQRLEVYCGDLDS